MNRAIIAKIRVVRRSGQNQESNIIRKYRQAEFMICNSCLWCASKLSPYYQSNCPACNSDKTESIPISDTEAFGIKIDQNGISMEFWNLN